MLEIRVGVYVLSVKQSYTIRITWFTTVANKTRAVSVSRSSGGNELFAELLLLPTGPACSLILYGRCYAFLQHGPVQ